MKKRAREETKMQEQSDSTASTPKRAKLVETPSEQRNYANTELYKHLKAKRIAKKLLKKANNKTLPKDELRQSILKQLREAIESDLSQLTDDAIAKFHVDGDYVSLKSRK
jgi:hypothetical protein